MAFWTLYKRELSSYFQSAVAYIVLFGSAVVQGIQFFVHRQRSSSAANYKEQSVMQIFFTWPLFWLLLLVQVPLITMRVFSEEFKLGTIEMLLTAPVREWDVVLAKFFGALSFFLILWLPIALDLTALQLFSNPPPPIYWSQIGLTALTIALVGGFYVSHRRFHLRPDQEPDHRRRALLRLSSRRLRRLALALGPAHRRRHLLAWISYVSLPEHLAKRRAGHLRYPPHRLLRDA